MTAEHQDLSNEIERVRGTGRVVCGEFATSEPSVASVAARFGLDPDPGNYRACPTREARYIAARVIAQHLVDDGDLASFDRSDALAKRFLGLFPAVGTSFFTNGEFRFFGNGPASYLDNWRQVTPERCSSGVLVLAPGLGGVLWVADARKPE